MCCFLSLLRVFLFIGGFGYDFSNPEKDVSSSIDAVSKGLLQHGVTSFCPTVITSSPEQYRKVNLSTFIIPFAFCILFISNYEYFV